jgi:hypothetical protein
MSYSRFSFLRRVRIHDGECGAVARALHHLIEILSIGRRQESLVYDK